MISLLSSFFKKDLKGFDPGEKYFYNTSWGDISLWEPSGKKVVCIFAFDFHVSSKAGREGWLSSEGRRGCVAATAVPQPMAVPVGFTRWLSQSGSCLTLMKFSLLFFPFMDCI